MGAGGVEEMAQTRTVKPREWLLLAFIAICLVLVGLIWWEGMASNTDDTPGFVRPTAAFEVDDEAYEQWNTEPETPAPTPGG